ncbi:MAG: hypothetical protein FI729_06425 [SAR202 cluster bacterium]|nr:hypothetical protein [SAR202 cluster bacterium]|tara:strand:- start:17861 stop:18559 length:699 start_codon:yes stop_codon:yes gene_type:complete
MKKLAGKYIVSLSVLIILTSSGCVTDPIIQQTDHVLSNIDSAVTSTNDIEYQNSVLVNAHELNDLADDLDKAETRTEQQSLVKNYITINQRISCIEDNIENSLSDKTSVECQGDKLVSSVDQDGLPGVNTLHDSISGADSEHNKRQILRTYLQDWEYVQRIVRVEKSLHQNKRTHEIILLGGLLKRIHQFPIMYEGEILVPTADMEDLMQDFVTSANKEEQRNLVIEYLNAS